MPSALADAWIIWGQLITGSLPPGRMLAQNLQAENHMPPLTLPTAPPPAMRETVLRQKAQELEAAFLSEMLAHAGFGNSEGAFGGGIGEAQFASFLRREQAEAMVAAGGVGLAESLFHALKDADHAD